VTIFATELAEGLGLVLPDPAKPILSLEPYFMGAWGSSGLGDFVSPFLDVARSVGQLVAEPLEFAAELLTIMDAIPAEVIPFVGATMSVGINAFKWKHERDVRESLFGLALGTGRLAQLGEDPVPAWANAVGVPSFIDCSDMKDARARTVVPPQKMPAPWRNPGSYSQPSGNCGAGYAVWCNFDHYPHGKKKPGAGGKRCSGKADVSALLYPYWTGARPPGPAPAFFAEGSFEREHFGTIDTNADMLAAQSYYLGTCFGNFSVRISDVVRMRNNLQSRVGKYIEMQVADPAQNYVLTDERLAVGITMCDAFIAARAAFVQTDEAVALSMSPPLAGRLDPDARAETMAWLEKKIAKPNVPVFVPGISVIGPQTPANQQYQVSDGEGPFVGYIPDLSAKIEAQNTSDGGGVGAIMLLAAGGLIYTLTRR